MRNVFRIFRNDLLAVCKHFFALLIVLAILILPGLYAWFNIYAFWDPYGNSDKLPIAIVSNDKNYINDDGEVLNMGNDLLAKLAEEENFTFTVLDDADQAIDDTYAGKYYSAIIIESDFTYNMYNFLTTDMFSPTITVYMNEKTNAIAVKVVEAAVDDVTTTVNSQYIEAIVETLFSKLNSFSADVEGDNPVEMIRNSLNKVNSNLISYSSTIEQFIAANDSLVDTLNRTNSTLDYSIYLIGNERLNISKQIYYIEDSQEDLALINAEVNKMLLNIQSSVQEAIYKLDRLYEGTGGDSDDAAAALEELERQYTELIDYLTHSGATGKDVEDALSALNTLVEKISALRASLGLDGSITDDSGNSLLPELTPEVEEEIAAIQTDYNEVTVPVVYKAATGYDYEDLSSSQTTQQSMESAVEYMMEDTDSRILSIQQNLKLAASTSDADERDKALTQAQADTAIVHQQVDAIGVAADAMESATTGITDSVTGGVSDTLDSASNTINSAEDLYDKIFSGSYDVDLTHDLQLISDMLGNVRVTLTETVYPTIDNLLDGMQDTLGDISSMLLDLSNILDKTQPVIAELGTTFGHINNALTEVQKLLSSYSGRIGELLDIIDDADDNDKLQSVFDFFNIDPETIGEFLASPVETESEAVYPVESYGAAMTPFYTMLAIWVGCVILNAIFRIEDPVELEGATERQVFFGRYLIFALLGLIQTMIIMVGDILIFDMTIANTGLFILSGIVTSLAVSMLAYAFTVCFGNIGRAIFVVVMIIQIAGSGGSYPIELLPDFFQSIYLLFPFPYAIGAMREAIAGLYQSEYLIYMLSLGLFFIGGLLLGLFLRKPLSGVNGYMHKQLEKTEMM